MRIIPLLVLMMGCGVSAYREPCEYDVHVRLTEEANDECHKFTMRDHNGVLLNKATQVYGCGNSKGIISNGSRSNVGHENGHVIEEFCPEWAKGYFN